MHHLARVLPMEPGHVTDGDPGMVAERLADFVDLSEVGMSWQIHHQSYAVMPLFMGEGYRKQHICLLAF